MSSAKRMVTQVVNGITQVRVDSILVYEHQTKPALYRHFDSSGKLIAEYDGGTKTWLVYNADGEKLFEFNDIGPWMFAKESQKLGDRQAMIEIFKEGFDEEMEDQELIQQQKRDAKSLPSLVEKALGRIEIKKLNLYDGSSLADLKYRLGALIGRSAKTASSADRDLWNSIEDSDALSDPGFYQLFDLVCLLLVSSAQDAKTFKRLVGYLEKYFTHENAKSDLQSYKKIVSVLNPVRSDLVRLSKEKSSVASAAKLLINRIDEKPKSSSSKSS